VQPDVLIVCDRDKITEACIVGAPDFVCEVISPSTSSYDTGLKLEKYLSAGVREYWVIDPKERIIYTHVLTEENAYITKIYHEPEGVPISILEGLTVDTEYIFEDIFRLVK
jgi:Uma2 family endonuclease